MLEWIIFVIIVAGVFILFIMAGEYLYKRFRISERLDKRLGLNSHIALSNSDNEFQDWFNVEFQKSKKRWLKAYAENPGLFDHDPINHYLTPTLLP
jgi:hypothetical protein